MLVIVKLILRSKKLFQTIVFPVLDIRMDEYLLSGDIAIRLDLISKVRDLDEAEKYFNSIPHTSKDFKVYGALLNCYAQYNFVAN
jgi:hypothetical protein